MQQNPVNPVVSVPQIGLRGIAYYLGTLRPIEEIPRLAADSALLGYFKFERFQDFARADVTLAQQAIFSARKTLQLAQLAPDEIDAVVIGTSELRDWHDYPEQLSSDILRGLGLNNVFVVGVTLAGCANFSSSLRVARNLIAVDGYRNVLIIETNQVRGDLDRLVQSGSAGTPACIFSDGAVSCIASAGTGAFSVLGMDQFVHVHPDSAASPAALVAKNIACCRRAIERALDQASLVPEQIDCILFANLNFMMQLTLRSVLGFTHTAFYFQNIKRFSHLWSADVLINLHDYCIDKTPAAGTRFLMVTQGSSYYSAIICQKKDLEPLAAAAHPS